jgi:hypothetical protein
MTGLNSLGHFRTMKARIGQVRSDYIMLIHVRLCLDIFVHVRKVYARLGQVRTCLDMLRHVRPGCSRIVQVRTI